MRRLAFFFILLLTLSARTAQAEETTFVPNKPLLVAGTTLMVAGYAPVAAIAVPSTLGLAYRGLVHALTLGMYYGLYCIESPEQDLNAPPQRQRITANYLCSGEHGAIQLLVPFAGPFLYLKNHPHDDIVHPGGAPFDKTTQAALVASGFAQLTGAAFMIAGVALGHSTPKPTKRGGVEWQIRPAITPTSIGLEASLVDF
jgi:hypothetical protein